MHIRDPELEQFGSGIRDPGCLSRIRNTVHIFTFEEFPGGLESSLGACISFLLVLVLGRNVGYSLNLNFCSNR
jgi:hypothetical protein